MEKDRGKRTMEEVAFFIPREAASYACFGTVGHRYSFDKTHPARVSIPGDISLFRSKEDLTETDAGGRPMARTPTGTISKTVTPSLPESPERATETEMLTGDRIGRGKKKADLLAEDTEESGAEEEERPRKKKKHHKEEDSEKKSKKKRHVEPSEDAEEVEEPAEESEEEEEETEEEDEG